MCVVKIEKIYLPTGRQARYDLSEMRSVRDVFRGTHFGQLGNGIGLMTWQPFTLGKVFTKQPP